MGRPRPSFSLCLMLVIPCIFTLGSFAPPAIAALTQQRDVVNASIEMQGNNDCVSNHQGTGSQSGVGKSIAPLAMQGDLACPITPGGTRAGGTIYVDRDAPGPAHDGLSWPTAFTEVQSALAVASSGDEIWVAEGVYRPDYDPGSGSYTGLVTATFVLTDGVALYGGFGGYPISETLRSQRDWIANVTVLSGDLAEDDTTDPSGVITDTAHISGTNAYHIVTSSGVADATVLDGFIITGGYAGGSDPHHRGGGMANSGGHPTLANVTFSGNYAIGYGGGMYNAQGDPALTDVTFSGNRADHGGGMCNEDGNPQLVRTTFSDNHSNGNGGGIYNDYSDPSLAGVSFDDNTSDQDGGGMCNYHSSPSVTNVTFHANEGRYGGGMHNRTGSHPSLTNVTFSANHADGLNAIGGAVYNDGTSSATLTNAILWSNTSSSDLQIGGFATANYSLVQGGWSGTGNLDVDPQFVDAANGDLRLRHTSPAVDAGDNLAVPGIVTTDLDGYPRFLDVASMPDTGKGGPPIVDMGAYEVAATDLYIHKAAIPGAPFYPGDPITYVLTFANGSSTINAGIVVTDVVPSVVLSTSIASGGVTITETQPSPAYVWQVSPLAPGQIGVITVSGWISPALAHRLTFTNTARIATTSVDTDTNDNLATLQSHVAGLIYVDREATGGNAGTSWADAFANLRDGLDVALYGDEIWVAEGIYTPTNVAGPDATFALSNGVAIYGGFVGTETLRSQRDWNAYVTVLSGDLNGDDVTNPDGVVTDPANIVGTNSDHVVTGNGVDGMTVLDGFTVTGGHASSGADLNGGGILNNDSDPTLANLTFIGNLADSCGGGMYNMSSNPVLTGVTFRDNTAAIGGGMCNDYSDPSLTNVTFDTNSSSSGGGGMYNSYSDPTLAGVTFGNNSGTYGGGMYNYDSVPVLTSVSFSSNSASSSGGGMYNSYSHPTLTAVIFNTNTTSISGDANKYGGGMTNNYSDPVLTHVIFNANHAEGDGGGMYNTNSHPTLIDVIFYHNWADDDGGGMCNSNSNPVLTNVTFAGNMADNLYDPYDRYGGGMYNYNSDPALTNVIFSGNWADDDGGGMYNYNSDPTLSNVTMSGNRGSLMVGYGGAIYNENSNPTLINAILWLNRAVDEIQIYNDASSSVRIDYSVVQNGCQAAWTCDHVTTSDPDFVRNPGPGPDVAWGTEDDDHGDLRLQASSPAIDAGDSDGIPPDALDLDGDGDTAEPVALDRAGNPRLVDHYAPDIGTGSGSPVDMGAYETPGLSIQKSASDLLLDAGDRLTYALSIQNGFGLTASDIVVEDIIPSHLDDLRVVTSGVQISPTGPVSYTWQIPDLAAGAGGTITISGVLSRSLAPGQGFVNAATLSGVANYMAVENSDSVSVTRYSADLAISKTDFQELVMLGERLIYTLTVTNYGPTPSREVVVTDTLPGGVHFVEASPGCGYAKGAGIVTCALPPLAALATAEVAIEVVAPYVVGEIGNSAVVTGSVPDVDAANNVAGDATWVSAEADLALAKTAGPSIVLAGDLLTYTLVITNRGPDRAGGVTLSDELPPGLTYAGRLLALHMDEPAGAAHFEDGSGLGHHGTCDTAAGTCPEAGLRGLYDYVVQFDGIDDWVESTDFDIANDFTISLWVQPFSDGDGQAFIGKHGQPGDDIFLFGFYDGGYYVNIRSSSYQTGTKTAGAWQHLAVVGRQTGPSTTEVTVYKDGHSLWQQALNQVVGDASGKGWAIGQDWDGGTRTDFFDGAMDEVIIYNWAMSAAEIAAMQDSHPDLPPVISQGECQLDAALTCDPKIMDSGATVTVILPFRADLSQAGTLTNTATVAGYIPDPASSNDKAAVTTGVSGVNLALNKTATPSLLFAGDTITYVVGLVNHGPVTATGVIVGDALPAGINFGSYTATMGVYTLTTGIWKVDTLEVGKPVALTVAGTVGAEATGQTLTNTAQLNASTPADALTQDNSASAAVRVAGPALMVSKDVHTGAESEAELGGKVTYTVAIRNDGEDVAAGVTVTDPLPTGVSFGDWVAQGAASLSLQTVEWGPQDVAAGTAYTVSFTANVTGSRAYAGQTIANVAYGACANADPVEDWVSFSIQGEVWIYLPMVLRDGG